MSLAKTVVQLEPADKEHPQYKYKIKFEKKTVYFGQMGASDYTMHKDPERMKLYITRHQKRETQYWDTQKISNLKRASYWSRWLLWNKPGLYESIADIQKQTGIKIEYNKKHIDVWHDILKQMADANEKIQESK